MRVGYVCEGGGRLGWGHVMRGRSLLAALRGPGGALLVGAGYAEVSSLLARSADAPPVQPWGSRTAPFLPADAPFDLVFADHYDLPGEWITAMASVRPTVVVDDWMRTHVAATALVNPNLGAAVADYEIADVSVALMGPEFALLRPEVRAARHESLPAASADVVVTFGGSDPEGRTADAVDALSTGAWFRDGGRLCVVLGAFYAGATPWARWPADRAARLDVVTQPDDFLTRCRASRLVVCGASTTAYEMACIGTPFLPVVLVGNQSRTGAAWAARRGGLPLDVRRGGWELELSRLVDETLASEDSRRAALEPADLVDGQGARRVLQACERLLRNEGGQR